MRDEQRPGTPTRRAVIAAGPVMLASQAVAAPPPHTVVELRQYKIVPGKRDEMIGLFETNLIEGQEAVGIDLIGQFRDLDDPNRVTWIRSFSDMARREAALNAFYFGPVWQASRGAMNPLLQDNDNVLLLKPAAAGSGFAAAARVDAPAKGGMVVGTIHYLWKAPTEGFDRFFLDRMAPELRAAGLPVLAAFVPETSENTFPRLPVRQGEKVFVWFTRAEDANGFEQAWTRLRARPGWSALEVELQGHEERRAQTLRLAPASRSKLR